MIAHTFRERPFGPTPQQRAAWGIACREAIADANAYWSERCRAAGLHSLAAERLVERRAFLLGTWCKVPAEHWPVPQLSLDVGRCNDDLAWLWANEREVVLTALAAWLSSVADGRLMQARLQAGEESLDLWKRGRR
jgi:hypothetical protein